MDRREIRRRYQEFYLAKGGRPPSVFHFCQELGIPETEFYSHFGSFDALERNLWGEVFKDIVDALNSEEGFRSASARAKMLMLFSRVFSSLREQRSFVVKSLSEASALGPCGVLVNRSCLAELKAAFREAVKTILHEARQAGEVSYPHAVGGVYGELFWKHFLCLLIYWIRDDSANFERTHRLLERTVNVSFDLLHRGVSDGVFDLVRSLPAPPPKSGLPCEVPRGAAPRCKGPSGLARAM